MVVVEARGTDGKLIELVDISLSDTGRIMITDDQGHQVFIHRACWTQAIKTVNDLLAKEQHESTKNQSTRHP